MAGEPSREAVVLAPATAGDAAELAELYLASRRDALPYLRQVHSDVETRRWVARVGDEVVGLLSVVGDDLDQLYLWPGWYRRGVGSRLLAKAKELSPGRLRLFTFQRNERARAFYEARGFRPIAFGDGSGNEEGEPDALYKRVAARDG